MNEAKQLCYKCAFGRTGRRSHATAREAFYVFALPSHCLRLDASPQIAQVGTTSAEEIQRPRFSNTGLGGGQGPAQERIKLYRLKCGTKWLAQGLEYSTYWGERNGYCRGNCHPRSKYTPKHRPTTPTATDAMGNHAN